MKKIMFAMLAVMCTTIANAAYLYWQVPADDVVDISEGWNAAQLYEDGNLVTSTHYWNSKQNSLTESPASTVSAPMGTGFVYNGDISSHSYYVALWHYNDTSDWSSSGHAVAQSVTISGSEIQQYVYSDTSSLTTTLMSAPTLKAWHAGGYRAVPEPTSGLMLLLGAAMLGLKRKNRSVA